MITEIVTFTLPVGISREELILDYEKSAQNWKANPDLIRKNYLYDRENGLGGGVYLWKNKGDAKKWHGEAFRQRILTTFGSEPVSQFFETPIVVDNLAGEITKE